MKDYLLNHLHDVLDEYKHGTVDIDDVFVDELGEFRHNVDMYNLYQAIVTDFIFTLPAAVQHQTPYKQFLINFTRDQWLKFKDEVGELMCEHQDRSPEEVNEYMQSIPTARLFKEALEQSSITNLDFEVV